MTPCFLYRFFDSEDRLLYVGISYHLERRLDAHRHQKPWSRIARIQIEHFPTREEAAVAEREAIAGEHPEWNVLHASSGFLFCEACQQKLQTFIGWEGKRYCLDCWERLDLPPPINRSRRSYYTKAKKRWPDAEWIIGRGRWASVAPCRVVTVALHETKEAAEVALHRIDRMGCGGFCTGIHSLEDLEALPDPW